MDAMTPPLGESVTRNPIAAGRSRQAATQLRAPVAVVRAAVIVQIDRA